MEEIWKDIYYFNQPTNEWIDYRGLYQVSNLGRVKSLDRTIKCADGNYYSFFKGKILSPYMSNRGYLIVALSKGDKSRTLKIHRLVAAMFIPNPDNLTEVNHKDENKTNNIVIPGCPELSNLEWCTAEYNHNYGTRNIRTGKTASKKVVQKDMNGNILNYYDSQVEAAAAVNGYSSLISLACRKQTQKTHKGYIWEYA